MLVEENRLPPALLHMVWLSLRMGDWQVHDSIFKVMFIPWLGLTSKLKAMKLTAHLVCSKEEELVEQARAAEEAVQHAREEMQRAEARCAAAEAAKIELSLRLAAALSEQEVAEDVSAVPSASARSVLSS